MTKKILIDETVVKQALEALESTGRFLHHCWCDVQMNEYSFDKLNKQMEIVDAEITALRGALEVNNKGVNALAEQSAQQAAEPVDKVAIMQRIVDSQTGHTRPVARESEQEPTCKQHLQVWVIPKGKGRGQFSWEPQDERFWTRMEPTVKQSLTVHHNQPNKGE